MLQSYLSYYIKTNIIQIEMSSIVNGKTLVALVTIRYQLTHNSWSLGIDSEVGDDAALTKRQGDCLETMS